MSSLTNDVTFRPLHVDDRAEILSWAQDEHFRSFIMDDADSHRIESITARLTGDMDCTRALWLIATNSHNQPIGAAWILPSSRTHDTGFLNTYVIPNARRASLGRRLSATCILRGFEKAIFRKVIILVHGANTASVSGLIDWAHAAGATLESVYRDGKPYKGTLWNIHRFAVCYEQQALLRAIVTK